MSSKKEKIKAMTGRALIIALVYSIILLVGLVWWQLINYRLGNVVEDGSFPRGNIIYTCPQAWVDLRNPLIPTLWWFFIPLFINAILPKKIRLNASELSFIWIMIAIIPTLTGRWAGIFNNGMGCAWEGIFFAWPERYWWQWAVLTDPASKAVILFNEELISPIKNYGGVAPIAIDWGSFAPSTLWWSVHFFSLWLIWTFWMAIMRRQMVDVEALPYPMAAIISNVISFTMPDEEGKRPIFRNKYILGGIIIGFLYMFVQNIARFLPGLGTPILWLDITNLANVNAVLLFSFPLFVFAFAMFQTQATLITTVAAEIVMYMILPGVFAAAGVIPVFEASNAAYPNAAAWTLQRYLMNQGGFRLTSLLGGVKVIGGMYHDFYFGAIAAFCILPIILHRSYFVDSIKAAVRGRKDPDEAFSYRWLWLGFILSMILFIVTLLIVQVEIQWILFFLAVAFVYMTGLMRVYAETGLVMGGLLNHEILGMHLPYHLMSIPLSWDESTQMPLIWAPQGEIYPGAYALNKQGTWLEFLIHTHLRTQNSGTLGSFPMMSVVDGWSLAERTKSRARDALIGMIISVVFCVTATLFLYVVIGNMIGHNAQQMGWWWTWAMSYAWSRWGYGGPGSEAFGASPDAYGNYIYMFIVGFVVITILSMLPRKYPGLADFISPAGIVLAYLGGEQMWFPFLVAWIVKYFTVRVTGVEGQRKVLIPLAIGILIGTTLIWPLTNFKQLAELLTSL